MMSKPLLVPLLDPTTQPRSVVPSMNYSLSRGQPHQIETPAGSAFLNFRGSVQLRTDSPFCALRCEHTPTQELPRQ
jgi:hypothetical protein